MILNKNDSMYGGRVEDNTVWWYMKCEYKERWKNPIKSLDVTIRRSEYL